MGFENETRCTTNEVGASAGEPRCLSRDAIRLTDARVSTESETASPPDVCRPFERVTFESQRAAGNRPRSRVSFDRFTSTFDGGAMDMHASRSVLPTVGFAFSMSPTQGGANPGLRHGTASKSTAPRSNLAAGAAVARRAAEARTSVAEARVRELEEELARAMRSSGLHAGGGLHGSGKWRQTS